MAKKIKKLSFDFLSNWANHESLFYVDEHFFIMMNARDMGYKHLNFGQPYRVDEGRVLIVKNGWVRVVINLEEHRLEKHMAAVLIPNSIFEIQQWSDDLDLQAFTFKDLPIFTSLDHLVVLPLDENEWFLAERYMELMWNEVKLQPPLYEAITHLQTALLLELKRIANREEAQQQKTATRHDAIFKQFLSLVNQYGLSERKIDFYADKICVTPNHLGAVIKSTSGLTIMQWLNRHAIQQAKVLLRYSDLPVWEIAERMNFANPSFFSKFFKKETGMTPGQYRNL